MSYYSKHLEYHEKQMQKIKQTFSELQVDTKTVEAIESLISEMLDWAFYDHDVGED